MSYPISGVIPLAGCVFYLFFILLAIASRKFKRPVSSWLLVFLVISFLWNLGQVLISLTVLPGGWIQPFNFSGLILCTVAFFFLTNSALQSKGRAIVWYGVSLVWLVLALLYSLNIIPPAAIPLAGQVWNLSTQALSQITLFLGWLVLLVRICYLLIRARRASDQPPLRNRAYYWGLGTTLVILSDVLFFASLSSASSMIRWIASVLLLTIVLRPYMPDIRQMGRRALSYLLMTLLTATILMAGLIISPPFFMQWQRSYGTALAGVLIALLLATLLSPLWFFSQKITNRLLPSRKYDSYRLLREYSQGLSNILDPELLATVAIGLISEAIEIQNGYLFLVDLEMGDGGNRYRLRGSKGMAKEQLESGILAYDSPIAVYLRQAHKPLLQSEIDLQPRYQSASPEEHAWLTRLGTEVYLPIYTKEEWAGLFALGAKLNGLPYLEDDLTLLRILADQTAVALQNARLVESLMRLNNDFRRAYAAMEQANLHLKSANIQLENLDRTKSDFIGVASHELRTPLTVMRGYNEMLMEDASINSNPYQAKLVKGIYSGISRLDEIIGSMLDMASIDTRSLELKVEPTSFFMIIEKVLSNLDESIKERRLSVEIENLRDLPKVEADIEAMRKVFYHLINNALKFTPFGGTITITGVIVSTPQTWLPEGGVEVIVSDTGVGINPENLELIFTKFYQPGELVQRSGSKSKTKTGGAGLGLAIAKGIVEAHRGKIWAESTGYDEERCPGSQFHVVLPLHYQEQT